MRVTTDKRIELAGMLRQRRAMVPMTLTELAGASGVSPSHLGRIERGERYPSARVLRRLAKPLGFDEIELLSLAEMVSPQTPGHQLETVRLDPYVTFVLSQEPLEIQRAVIFILSAMKSMAKGMSLTEKKTHESNGTTTRT